MLIDYKVGAGGALCWMELIRARPDGYTIAGINLPHIVLQPLRRQSGYATEDLVPVALFQRTPLALVVLEGSAYRTLDDLLRAARAEPDGVTVGGSGTFTGPHFMTRRLARLAGARLKYVPFNGGAPAMTNLLGGHTMASVAYSDDLVRYAGQIRVLALADTARFAAAPDAPTFRELGHEIVEVVDRGVAVPRGTPPEVVSALEGAFLAITRDAGGAGTDEEGRLPPPRPGQRRGRPPHRRAEDAVRRRARGPGGRVTVSRSMKTQRSADVAVGAAAGLLGAAVLVSARGIERLAGEGLTPRAFPVAIALALLASGAAVALAARRHAGADDALDWPGRDGFRRIAIVAAATAVLRGLAHLRGFPPRLGALRQRRGRVPRPRRVAFSSRGGHRHRRRALRRLHPSPGPGAPFRTAPLTPVQLLAQGFTNALSPENLLYAFAGSLIGTLVGVLPGIGPTAGLAILMPLTAVLSPSAAVIMMAAVYYGAMYGGSTTAIVVNIPGEAASVPTALDGYPLARQGRAAAALGHLRDLVVRRGDARARGPDLLHAPPRARGAAVRPAGVLRARGAFAEPRRRPVRRPRWPRGCSAPASASSPGPSGSIRFRARRASPSARRRSPRGCTSWRS